MSGGSRPRGAPRLTHLDAAGRARMVDVGAKPVTAREAAAEGSIRMSPQAFRQVRAGRTIKGDAVGLARFAGIAAAKNTAALIPLCHAIPLDHVDVAVEFEGDGRTVTVRARTGAHWRTGVEMEALVAVSAALLTLYDMAKAIDRGMRIGPLYLSRKSGGRSGTYVRHRRGRRGSPRSG